MKRYVQIFLSVFFLSGTAFSQLIVEDFNYPTGDPLTSHGYHSFLGGSTNAIKAIDGSLTYQDYPSSGIGNMIQLGTTGQSVYDSLPSTISSGTLYAAMLVNIDSAQSAGDFFFLFGKAPIDTFFYTRTLIKQAENGNLSFGINKSRAAKSIDYSDSIYTTGETYLLVVAYKFAEGENNDTVKMWINPEISLVEPPADLISWDSLSTDIEIGTYAFRQGYDTAAAFLKLDGLRIDTTWFDAVVPVELTSFSSIVKEGSVILNWTTSSEINNKGFEVQRKAEGGGFIQVGFINGKGTTSEKNNYSYIDQDLSSGRYMYRLKQIDYDGRYKYSNLVSADITAPSSFELKQNYPNPFNPSTTIKFNLAVESKVTMTVYNIVGQEIAQILNSQLEAGLHSINFNANSAGGLNSGVYFYKLNAAGINGENFSSVKKMILTK